MFFKKKEAGSDGRLLAVQTGLVVPVSEVDDPVFAQSILGGGVAIRPEGNEILSPASGRIISVQDTGHAYGLRTDDGMEILVHIGINTMELKGRGFSPCVRTGQKIRRAEPLCRIDLPLLRQLGYQTDGHKSGRTVRAASFLQRDACAGRADVHHRANPLNTQAEHGGMAIMTEFSYTVHDDNGIHARPAGLLVSQAQKHPCSIRMFCGERQADCKRLFQVMGLNVKQGETVRICCEGDAEAEAAQALKALMRAQF